MSTIHPGPPPATLRLGLRWIVEATNSWWPNYGQVCRNTDRRTRHRLAALCPAAIIIVGRLIDWRNRWIRAWRLSARALVARPSGP